MSQVSTFPSGTRFRVLSHLGTGGMGVVYEALDLERETRVAIKTLRIAGPSQLMRLKREFRALRDVQHPNLVSLGELFEHDGLWFFTMELVQGTSIRQYVQLAPESKTTPEVGPAANPDHLCLECGLPGIGLLGAHTPDERSSADPYGTPACNADATVTGATTAERVASALHAHFGLDEWPFCSSRGPRRAPCFDEQRLRHALKGLGAGLAALHRAGKVHCDIKPSNVMVTREGRVVVLDFSVVTELRTALGPRSCAVMGSPAYMAPEQTSGDQVYPATDWYAVGVLLYEAMTGQLPFMGRSSAEIVARKLRGPAPYPGDVVAEVPADLAALCHDLLATRPEDRPDEADILAVLGVAPEHAHGSGSDGPWSVWTVPRVLMPEPLFVGRKGALARLHAAFEDTRSGRSVSVLIEGESGVGKTATAERFVAGLGREVVVLRGQCHEREFVPYNAFDGVVDDMSRYLRASFGSGPLPWQIMGVAPLLSVFPVLRGVPGLVELAAQDAVASLANEKRAQAFAALRTLLTHVAGQTAMVIMIHDLHWADVDSLMLLSELMGACESPPLLFLATARTREDGGSCPAAHGIRGDLRRIELGGLAGDEAKELALRLFEVIGGGFSALIPQVVAETSGHPMLMDALVRHVARGDAHGDTRGDAHDGDARDGEPDAAGMLPRLDDALRARARAQSDDARALLEIIAVAGAPVEQEILGPASDLPVEALNKELAVLRAANLVRTSGDLRTMVMPYHDRVREVVTGSLTPSRLREIHGRLAHALEAAGAEPVRLAPHYFRAGELAQAAAHAAAAAASARESLAFDQAVELYRLALRAGGHSPGATRQLIIELGMALQNAGRARDAAMAYGTAAALAGDGDARRDPSDAQTLDLERRAAEQLLMGGYMEDGIEAIRAVLAQESLSFPGTGKRALIGTMWNMLVLRARGLRWRPRAESELPAEALRAIDTCWSAAAGLSMVDSTLGMFFATRGLRLALRQGEPYRIARAACTAAVVASAIDDTVAAERFIAASARAARQDGGEQARFYVEAARFMQTFFHAQSWRHVVDSGQELENLWHAAGNGRGFESDFVTQFSCFALSFLGDMGELGRRIEALVGDARRVGNRFLEVSLRVYHIMVHLAADDPAGGAADAADAIDSWIPGHDVFQLPHVWALCSRAEAMLYSGEAAERAGELAPGFQRLAWSSLQSVGFIRDISNYAEGRVAVAEALGARSSNPTRMQERLRAAARCADALVISPHPVPPLWGTMLRAGIAGVRGEPEHALAHLRHASSDLAATETMLHAAAAIHRMGELLAGDEGAALIAQATAMMRSRSVREPQKITATLIPGW